MIKNKLFFYTQLIIKKLFYLLPNIIKKYIIKRRWEGDYGDKWYQYHLETRDTGLEPAGWENRKDVIEFVFKNVKPINNNGFLDYGCGNGLFTNYIKVNYGKDIDMYGYDINKSIIKKNSVRFNQINFTIYKDLEGVSNIYDFFIIYFGSTMAYLDLVQIKLILEQISKKTKRLCVVITDTVKGEMPELISSRGNFAYNYNIESVLIQLGLEITFVKVKKVENYHYQQVAGIF